MTKGRILYSSDGSGKNLVKDQQEKEVFEEIIPEQICLKFRIEKKGRGGKDVTVIYNLPYNPPYFKKLLKELKKFVGGGGAQKEDCLELQGDHRAQLKIYLEIKGFKTKGA